MRTHFQCGLALQRRRMRECDFGSNHHLSILQHLCRVLVKIEVRWVWSIAWILEYDNNIIIMGFKLKILCLILSLAINVSSFYIIPLRAGTVQFTDSEIRSDKLITKLINLNLSKTEYIAHKDINTIASITSLSMDQNLNFYFNYTLECPEEACFLNFSWIRYSEVVPQGFNYRIEADYLVARGLKVMDLNMTSFQNHLFMKHIVSYDQNNQREDLSKDIPFNNEDAWYMLLFPSGFNNLSLTGHVVYSYLLNTDMYVVHYMDHSGGHGEHDSMGWPENGNYIKYRAVFVPPSYLKGTTCIPIENFTLTQHFRHSCDGGDKVKWFAGFKSTKETEIQGELFQSKSGFAYSLARTPTRYGLMAFPFEVTPEFIDLRTHEYKWDGQYRRFGEYLGYLIGAGITTVVLFLCYAFFKPFYQRSHKKKLFKPVNKYQGRTQHEEVSNYEPKNSP